MTNSLKDLVFPAERNSVVRGGGPADVASALKGLGASLGVYSFSVAAITKYHKLGGLTQQKFLFLQFWMPEVQNQGVGTAVPLLKAQ